jgi:hypothetical protein
MSRLIIPFFLVFFSLQGCSFRPLLGENSSAQTEMPLIRIALIKDRNGQKLRNHLINLIIPKGTSHSPLYELHIALDVKEGSRMFSLDQVAQRKETKTKTKVNLIDLKTKAIIWSQDFSAQNAYSISGNTDVASFSTYIAKETSQNRTFEILAYDIYTHLAAFFEEKSNLEKPKKEENSKS